LSFGGDGIFDPVKILAVDESYRAPEGCVSVDGTSVMVRDALFETAAGGADVVRAVGAA
jgi:hypothetical protein